MLPYPACTAGDMASSLDIKYLRYALVMIAHSFIHFLGANLFSAYAKHTFLQVPMWAVCRTPGAELNPKLTTVPNPQHGLSAMCGSRDTGTSERKAASSVGWRSEELVIMQNPKVSLLLFINGSFIFATYIKLFSSLFLFYEFFGLCKYDLKFL